MAYYSEKKLKKLGIGKLGVNVKISEKVSIYFPEMISIGDNVRIDDYVCLSGEIIIGNNVHIANLCTLTASNNVISMGDFSGLAFGVHIFASSDDYSGLSMTNPTVSADFKNVKMSNVTLGRHVTVGANSVIFPGSIIEEGCAIGSLSLVNSNLTSWGIYAGIPAKRIKERSMKIIELEKLLHKKLTINSPLH